MEENEEARKEEEEYQRRISHGQIGHQQEATLLTRKQMEEIFLKNDERIAEVTDFVDVDVNGFYDIERGRRRFEPYWLGDPIKERPHPWDDLAMVVGDFGILEFHGWLEIGVRPVLNFLDATEIPTNGKKGDIKAEYDESGHLKYEYVEYGYYPQMLAKNQEELYRAYKIKKIKKTGNKYTANSHYNIDEKSEKSTVNNYYELDEYIDEKSGKRYVISRVKEVKDLFDGEVMIQKTEKMIFIEVSPIKWRIDREKKFMMTDKITIRTDAYDRYKFINDYWLEEIKQGLTKNKSFEMIIATIKAKRKKLKAQEKKLGER